MPSISSHDYDCPTQTLTVVVDAEGSQSQYRVYAVVVPDGQSLPSGDLPPVNAPSSVGSGDSSVPVNSPTWPTSGSVIYRIWVVVTDSKTDGSDDCGGDSSSSSSQSSSSSSSM